MNSIFLSTVFNLIVCLMHPLHIAICEMEYDEKRSSLEITQRIFLDDLEQEMRRELKRENLVLTDLSKSETEKLLKDYIERHIEIFISKEEKEVSFVGFEYDRDAVFIYFEVANLEIPTSIRVKNDILINYFEDQVNLVHIEVGGELQSLKMEGMVIQGTVEFH